MRLDEVFSVEEVKRLRDEACDLKETNLELKRSSEELAKEKDSADQKVLNLLSEKSELITECDSLGPTVKDLGFENTGLKAFTDAAKEEHVGKENLWVAKRLI